MSEQVYDKWGGGGGVVTLHMYAFYNCMHVFEIAFMHNIFLSF